MKVIQKITPKIELRYTIDREYCCDEYRRNNQWLKPGSERRFVQFGPVTKEDLAYNYCPFCGTKIELVDVWPSRQRVKDIIKSFAEQCGFDLNFAMEKKIDYPPVYLG